MISTVILWNIGQFFGFSGIKKIEAAWQPDIKLEKKIQALGMLD